MNRIIRTLAVVAAFAAQVLSLSADTGGVCSWSWATNMTGVLERMDMTGTKRMSLALSPWLRPSDGSEYQGPFGVRETGEMFASISNKIATGELIVPSTMLSFPKEDWGTYESITNTVGIMYTGDPADPTGAEAWTVHSNLVEQAAILTKKLGVRYVTCFVGFLMKPIMVGGVNVNADGAIGLARLHAAQQYCDKHGVTLLLESGHYSGAETMDILAKYEQKYGAGEFPLAINYDAANHLVYGNDTPHVAYEAMKSRIGQVHVKDANKGPAASGFAVDVKWGTGEVSTKYDLLGYLREQGYTGDLLVECEAGDTDSERIDCITAALTAIRLAGEYPNLLLNGSFENPQNATSFYEHHRSGEEGLGWQTLALDGQIEIGSVCGTFGSYARSAYGATRADDGYQFAELAANAVGALFQKVPTVPGKTYRWSWSRKARFKTEASAFWTLSPEKFEEAKALYLQYLRGEQPLSVIRPAVQALTNEHFVCTHADVAVSGDTTTWTRYEGMYTVPAGQTETYVVLVEWNGNPEDSSGCLVDSVAFGEELPMRRGIVEVYNVKGGAATVAVGGDTKTLEGEGSVYGFYPTNETLSITAEPADGYTFLGAFVSGYVKQSETGVQGTEFLSALELKTCPIHAGRQTLNLAYGKDCTVSFLPNGGSYACAETTLAKTPGSNCIPGTPTREGFNFDGWRERTTLKILQANTPIFWMDGNLVAYDIDGKKISLPAADGLQLRACWSWNRNWIPDASVTFKDGFGESYTYELKRNESMPASANPTFEHREGFVEYELVGWREPTFGQVLSTNVTAAYVGVRNPADGGTDGVLMLMDAAGNGFAATNHPGVLLKARWAVKHTNEWAVFNGSVDGGVTNYFDTLSTALAALKKGDTLLARPPAEGYGFGEGLKPDTNDVIRVDCAFVITTDDVTVDLNGRVLNRTVDGKADDYLISVVGAKGVTIRNGHLLSVGDSYDHSQRLGPQACRGIKIDNLAEVNVEDMNLYYHPYPAAVLVDRSSTAQFLGCFLDGEGDGDEQVVCVRSRSVLTFKDCMGQWDVDNFWNNPILRDSLDNITGEQFLVDDSKLVLDNTVISNSYDYAKLGALPYIVTTRGESTITLMNGAGIREGAPGTTQGAIHVENGSCTVGNGKADGLQTADGFVIGRMVAEEGATLVAGAATYSDDPTRFLPKGGKAIVGERGYSVVVSSGSKIHDKLEYAVAASGIENIHVNKFVPFEDPALARDDAGNASMWIKMTEGGFAQQLYLDQHNRGLDAATNSLPDVFFPTNTLAAHVWRGQGAALTNAFNLLTTDVAKTIFDPEVVNLLTNFSPLVKSVTRGVGSATIPYVDSDGKQQLGKAVVMGCVPGDVTAYEILVNELKRIGDGYEEFPSPGVRRFVLTNSTSRILGSRTPSVAFGPLGYTVLCSSKGVDDIVGAVSIAYRETGKKPFYDRIESKLRPVDDELSKRDPDYIASGRKYKIEGFERFGYAFMSSGLLQTMAKMVEQLGLDPAIVGTNRVFRYFATLCSETCSDDNSRMRIDLQGSEAVVRSIGFSIRFTNLLLVNAGIVDKDFMTFDEAWKFDPEALEQISGWLSSAREQLGINGANYYFTELEGRTKTVANIGYKGGRGFEQLFCAGKAGGREENPCEACLPTNTVAAFCFQPSAAAWTELNERLFTLLGKKSEALDQIFAAFRSHSSSFGKSASVGVVLGSGEVAAFGSAGAISNALGFVSCVKIEDDNLWLSLRILLEQYGCKTMSAKSYPTITICELPDSTLSVAYDREYKIIDLASSRAVGHLAAVARRNREARLISPINTVFNDRMGIKEGETLPDHNTLFYFAPESDAVLVETLKEYLDSIGLGALGILIREDDLSATWACGLGKADAEKGEFLAESNISKAIWDKYHGIFEVTATTLGQILAEAYPYDASKARVFKASDMTFHVSRADNWDDVNHCLYPYDGDNIRVRVQTVDSEGKVFDKVVSCRLGSDGYFAVDAGGLTCSGYLSSEGVFGETFNIVHGYFIGRETTEIEPELSVLPSAEEIAAQVKQVVEAIGISNVTVGAAKSDDRTGPFGEPTVVRETTIVPVPGGGLDRLFMAAKSPVDMNRQALYMPSNTVFGAAFGFSDGALTNAIAAIRYIQPELMKYFEKLFGDFGFDKEILASTKDGIQLGLAKEVDDLEPYLAIRLNRGQNQSWVDLTNRLYHTTGVMVRDFQTSQTPGEWEAIAFIREDPLSGHTIERCYTRIFESENRDPFFIITQDTAIGSGITVRVRGAGLHRKDCLIDDLTFRDCWIPLDVTDPNDRGFVYLAPIAEKHWFFEQFSVTEDGELVIKRRTSAVAAPIESTIARFAVNFFEALRGESSKITFENDPETDKTAEAATSNVVAMIHRMRTKLGVTGLDFYDADPDEDGRYGNSELAIGTRGDDCEFFKRFAATEPASEHLVETYIPATASAFAKGNAEPGLLADDVDISLKAFAALVGEKYPEVAVTITNFLASDTWKVSAESIRLTGTHKAMAVLQDFEHPFVKPIGGGSYAGISAGYSVLAVFGPMESSLPFLLLRQALTANEPWTAFETNGVEYLVHNGQFDGRDLSQFLTPTFAYRAADKVMVCATSVSAAREAIRAGRNGENRLIDSATFFDATGFKPGEPMPEHNTLYYFAPQNDDILGCTLRRVLSPYLPESYAMLLDRPSLKGYWGAAYGKRVNDAFRLYVHAGIKGHTAFLAAGQALLKTAAEGLRVRQPYDWKETRIAGSADTMRLIEPTDEAGSYLISSYGSAGEFIASEIWKAGSDNAVRVYSRAQAKIMSKNCVFISSKSGAASYNAGRDAFHLLILDAETDPFAYTGGIAMCFDAREQTFPAGEKVSQKLRLCPSDAEVTEVSGLPEGLSLEKTEDGTFLTGTPTKVGEDCRVKLTATCAGRQKTSQDFHLMISNYKSAYAALEENYGNFSAGVEGRLELPQVAGWDVVGLPTGLTFDKKTGTITGKAVASSDTTVVYFFKEINGQVERTSTILDISVGELELTVENAVDDVLSTYVGVRNAQMISVKGLAGVDNLLVAEGLPTGLELMRVNNDYRIVGVARETSESEVTVTAVNGYGWKGSVTFTLSVEPLPNWAVGKFFGAVTKTTGEVLAEGAYEVFSDGRIVGAHTAGVDVVSFSAACFERFDAENASFRFTSSVVIDEDGATVALTGAVGRNTNAFSQTVGRLIFAYDIGEYLCVGQADQEPGEPPFPASRTGVCSWSWATNMTGVLERMDERGLKMAQLSLVPWLKPSDGSKYDPSSFGPVETQAMFEAISNKVAEGELTIVSTMVAFPHEDWSSSAAITNTCGFMYTAGEDPTGSDIWEVNSNLVEQAAILSERLGVKRLSASVGFLMKPIMIRGVNANENGRIGLARLHQASEICANYGVTLLLEVGQYSGAETMAIIAAYENEYGASDIKVCFDMANNLIYGNDTPTNAYMAVKSRIGQVHLSDTFESEADRILYGGGFAADVRWGTGDVSVKYDFLKFLRDDSCPFDILVECQTSGERTSNVDAALKAILLANNDDPEDAWIPPQAMEGDTPGEKCAAALKAQGFADDVANSLADAGLYTSFRGWAEAKGLDPNGLTTKEGVILASAYNAPDVEDPTNVVIMIEDLVIGTNVLSNTGMTLEDFASTASGSAIIEMTFMVNVEADGYNGPIDENLLKASLGVEGTTDLEEMAFSPDALTFEFGAVTEGRLPVTVVPKKVGGENPDKFFLRTTAK